MKNVKIILILFFLSSCDLGVIKEDHYYEALEYSYFEGQKDALNGDIKIKKNNDSCWIWMETPWESGRPPIFNPSYNCK